MASKHNLRSQVGCHNCEHCFVRRDYDEGDTYFCNIDGDRPVCPSTLMGEYLPATNHHIMPRSESRKLRRAAEDAWDEWAGWRGKRERDGWQICDKWEKRQD